MTEPRETRIKRLKMRAMRRGIKEMDIILSAYSDRRLARMDDTELSLFDSLLHENDQDLYQWVTAQSVPPEKYVDLIQKISQTFQNK